MARSRRRAREAALQALYKIELAKSPIAAAVEEMRGESDLPSELAAYAEHLIRGVREHQPILDAKLKALVRDYDYARLAVVDKLVMRIAAYELFFEPSIPPAVSLDEAIEIARRYSTVESGAFVNGVLDALRAESPKANWDASAAPPEFAEEPARSEPVEIVEETIAADSEEAKKLSRVGGWKLRADR